ncbi:MAG: magnesium transporter [Planctomycetota bacterium]|nr:magnesium transporter [Planctomycetota bacterium]MDA1142710.1 magnesium transporter [Planctomycetota bacterium]
MEKTTEPEVQQEPWERIEEILEETSGTSAELRDFLDELAPGETARALSRLDEGAQTEVLTALEPEHAAEIIEEMSDAQAADLLEDLSPQQAATIVDELPSNEQADILNELDKADAQAILEHMTPQDAEDARALMQYPEDSAGGIMITEFLAFDAGLTVEDVLQDLRQNSENYSDYAIQYAYVTEKDRLAGVLPLRDLLLSRPRRVLRDLMIAEPLFFRAETPLDELRYFFGEHAFLGVPTVDMDAHLIGVVLRSDVEEAAAEEANENFLKVSGIGNEELRSMPLLTRSRGRLSWLSINIVLNILAASVIAFFQDTLQEVIALAVFLPIISDMSGCSGNQAVAVSMRELTLGLVKPYEFLRVFLKEVSIGIINGASLGILIGIVAFIWKGNAWLSLVIGSAMMLNTILAVCLGGVIPLVLKSFNSDPALASGPILTTVTDMFGFFFVLGFASLMLPRLVG